MELDVAASLDLPQPLVDTHARPNTPPRPPPASSSPWSDADMGAIKGKRAATVRPGINSAEPSSWLTPGMVFTGHQSFYSPSFAASKDSAYPILHSDPPSVQRHRPARGTAISQEAAQVAASRRSTSSSQRSSRHTESGGSTTQIPYRVMLSRIFDDSEDGPPPALEALSSSDDDDNSDQDEVTTDEDMPPLVPHDFAEREAYSSTQRLFTHTNADPLLNTLNFPQLHLPVITSNSAQNLASNNERHPTSALRPRRDPAENQSFWDYHLALERMRRIAEREREASVGDDENTVEPTSAEDLQARARRHVRRVLERTTVEPERNASDMQHPPVNFIDSAGATANTLVGGFSGHTQRWPQRDQQVRPRPGVEVNLPTFSPTHVLESARMSSSATSEGAHAGASLVSWHSRRNPSQPARRAEWDDHTDMPTLMPVGSPSSETQAIDGGSTRVPGDLHVNTSYVRQASDAFLYGSSRDRVANTSALSDTLLPRVQPSTSFLQTTTSNPLSFDHHRPRCRQLKDQWDVKVFIQQVDWDSGLVSGVMEAQNVPRTPQSIKVCTHFSGDIIDGINHSLFRPALHWQSKADVDKQRAMDQKYWAQLSPFSRFLSSADAKANDKFANKCQFEFLGDKDCYQLIKEGSWNYNQDGWLLMRWKERAFVNLEERESNLTISGFYYIALSRKTGAIEGLYLDPVSTPYQRLNLGPATCMDQPVLASYDIL